jgi:hypothetical protein
MDVGELLAELEQQQPGLDLEHKLVALIERMRDPDEVVDLKSQIEELKAANDRLEQTVNALRNQQTAQPEPVDHTYTIEQFMVALASKLGRTYGWKTDYAQATKDTPGSHSVDTDDIHRWQKERRVPDWAYTQIAVLDFRARIGRGAPEWKSDEVQHLVNLYQADPHEPNASLANKCSDHFGREITEQAIKGAVYRLGRQGRLPLQRPPREKTD